jgi:polar amino acid transport system substrate-binding protein
MNSVLKRAFIASAILGLAISTTTSATAATKLPANIAKAGVINIGIDATYSPNEFKDKNGKVIGWEVDLFNAVAKKLGVKTNYVIAGFDTILAGVKAGKYDVGVSSFTDTKERQASVDFVNYFSAGTQWAVKTGVKLDPDNACGKIVSAMTGSTQADDISAKSEACTKAGKKAITLLTYDSGEQATSAVILGRADATAADSPVLAYAVKQTKGKLALAGKIFGEAPYGIAVAKKSTLAPAIQEAFAAIKKDGTYDSILKKWGVEAGAVSKFTINGATA